MVTMGGMGEVIVKFIEAMLVLPSLSVTLKVMMCSPSVSCALTTTAFPKVPILSDNQV